MSQEIKISPKRLSYNTRPSVPDHKRRECAEKRNFLIFIKEEPSCRLGRCLGFGTEDPFLKISLSMGQNRLEISFDEIQETIRLQNGTLAENPCVIKEIMSTSLPPITMEDSFSLSNSVLQSKDGEYPYKYINYIHQDCWRFSVGQVYNKVVYNGKESLKLIHDYDPTETNSDTKRRKQVKQEKYDKRMSKILQNKMRPTTRKVTMGDGFEPEPEPEPDPEPEPELEKDTRPYYLNLLGFRNKATNTEIKKKYRELILLHHPDKGGDPEMFKEIDKAYRSLMGNLKKTRRKHKKTRKKMRKKPKKTQKRKKSNKNSKK